MSLARDVIERLRRAVAVIAEACDTAAAAQGQADEIIAEIRIATDGSGAEKPAEAIVRLEQAKVRLDEAKLEFAAGAAAAAEYIAEGLGGESGGSAPAPKALRPTPIAVERLAHSLPIWRKRHKARALAYVEDDGAEVEFTSGEDLSSGSGLLPDYAARTVVTDHAEGHLAARMRQPGGPRQVTMVINKEPCEGPLGCDATLPKIIPRDSTVTVYVRDADGVRFWGAYRGTGEGIR